MKSINKKLKFINIFLSIFMIFFNILTVNGKNLIEIKNLITNATPAYLTDQGKLYVRDKMVAHYYGFESNNIRATYKQCYFLETGKIWRTVYRTIKFSDIFTHRMFTCPKTTTTPIFTVNNNNIEYSHGARVLYKIEGDQIRCGFTGQPMYRIISYKKLSSKFINEILSITFSNSLFGNIEQTY